MSLTLCSNNNEIIILKNNFIENKAILYVWRRNVRGYLGIWYWVNILFEWCHFVRNSAVSGGGLAAILYGNYLSLLAVWVYTITIHNLLGTRQKMIVQPSKCTCGFRQDTHDVHSSKWAILYNVVHPLTYEASTVSVNNIKSFHLISSQILSNKGSAIHARESEISLEGDVVIADNTAYVGGALHLDCYHSLVSDNDIKHHQTVVNIVTDSSVLIRKHTALHFGGGIALNEQCGPQTCDQTTPRESCTIPCFFNILEHKVLQ